MSKAKATGKAEARTPAARPSRLVIAAALLFGFAIISPVPAQEREAPSLMVRAAEGYRPVLRFGGVLQDPELAEAVHSGLPVRLRVRIELWRDRLIDELASSQSWSGALSYDPLEREYIVRARGAAAVRLTFKDFSSAIRALEGPPTVVLRPRRAGNYYFTATIQIETLSLSDLEELERWLQGELQPAVSGERSVPGAVGEGAKRLLIRVLGLPTRTIDLKTDDFRFPDPR